MTTGTRLTALDWLVLAGVIAVAVTLASVGLTDEGALSFDGDMPRYLMNGVFLRDLIHDFPLRAPLEWAWHYYARYPALSLGHHPILPAIVEAPFFLVFGVSVFAARVSVLAALVVTMICWFRLVRSIYDTPTAAFASLLLVTIAGFTALFRVVLSEPYTLCLLMTSVYAMHRYTETEERRYAVAFVASAILSVYAKHLAVVMFPVYAFQLAYRFGARRLIARPTIIATAIIAVGILPIVPLTLKYSQFNVRIVTEFVDQNRATNKNLMRFIRRLVTGPFSMTPALLALSAVGALGALAKRDRRALLPAVWIVSVYASLVAIGVGNDRFACYWLPPFAALAASTLQLVTGSRRLAAAAALSSLAVYQGVTMGPANARERGAIRLAGGDGFEEAAALVVNERHGDAVLYSAQVDSGFFPFFVRKHDTARQLVVLRADKILTTSRMGRLDFEKRMSSPSEILPALERFGVGYVVVEHHADRQYPDGPLRWLEDSLPGDRFALVNEFPVDSSDRRLQAATVRVYRYGADPHGDPSAAIDIQIPAMQGAISVRLSELTGADAASSR